MTNIRYEQYGHCPYCSYCSTGQYQQSAPHWSLTTLILTLTKKECSKLGCQDSFLPQMTKRIWGRTLCHGVTGTQCHSLTGLQRKPLAGAHQWWPTTHHPPTGPTCSQKTHPMGGADCAPCKLKKKKICQEHTPPQTWNNMEINWRNKYLNIKVDCRHHQNKGCRPEKRLKKLRTFP